MTGNEPDPEMTTGRIQTQVPMGVQARSWSKLLLAPQVPQHRSILAEKYTAMVAWGSATLPEDPCPSTLRPAPSVHSFLLFYFYFGHLGIGKSTIKHDTFTIP